MIRMNNEVTTRFNNSVIIRMAITQLLAVALFAMSTIVLGLALKTGIVICCLLLLVLTTCWPMHVDLADRIIALGSGLLSMWCATLALKGLLPTSVIDNSEVSMDKFIAAIRPYERWAVAFALILVAATFIGFARQMLREPRTQLVRNIAHTLLASIACAALPGWLFLPSIIHFVPSLRNPLGGTIVAICCIILMILLNSIAYIWVKHAHVEAHTLYPEVGFALLPVMFSGMLIYAAGLGMLLVA